MTCIRCGHADADHCKGGKQHTNPKEDARMLAVADRKLTRICVSRHCEHPLCCCVAYVEPVETPAEREAWLDAMARDGAA